MSDSLTSSLVKAVKGDYRIPIKSIFLETWQRVTGMKKSFWGGFLLFLLTMSVFNKLQGFILMDIVYKFKLLDSTPFFSYLLKCFLGSSVEVLRSLLTFSLTCLALQHLRNQPTRASMVFSFRKTWRPLALIFLVAFLMESVLYFRINFFLDKIPSPLLVDYKLYFNHYLVYLLNSTLEFCMNFFSKAITELVPLDFFRDMGLASAKFIYVLDNHLSFVLFGLLCAYSMIGIFMATLLIFDKKNLTLKSSLSISFKFINRYLIKKIVLILLCFGLGYVVFIFFFISNLLYFVLFALLNLYISLVAFMASLLIFDKKLTLKKSLSTAFKSINRHLVRNIILILLTSLGFVSISMISLWIGVISFWIGLIWLLPMISLVTAIQYEQIFCEGKLI
ncbi:MAG: hypothetical protein RJA83_58 [Pseudomonadota bacterium]|jgi:hypothetical protein